MAKITAVGVPRNYPEIGEIEIRVIGDDVRIQEVLCLCNGMKSESVKSFFLYIMKKGPSYPLASEPNTMLRASQVLSQQFYGKRGNVFRVEGTIEPMEYDPDVIY